MMQFSNFEHAIIKSKALSILFDEYRYEDLLVAFFCVSIKRNNRSTLENCLSMNNALLEHSDKKCGIKPIVTYEEFTQFFTKLKKILPITCNDDYILPDFGEVKLVFNGKAYKTFIGTGHTQNYAYLSYLNVFAIISKKEEIFEQILEFYDGLISFFECVNTLENIHEIEFNLPSKDLFERTKQFFHNYNHEKNINIYNHVKKFTVIEQQYFVKYANKILPLFNTSLVIDVFSDLVAALEETEQNTLESVTNLGLAEYMNSANELADDFTTSNFIFPAVLFSDNKPIPQTNINFVIRTANGLIFCIEQKLWECEKNIFKDIVSKTNNNVILVETRKRANHSGAVAINITQPKKTVRFIVYSALYDINSPSISLEEFGEQDQNTLMMSSLDLISLLEFSDSVNEIWDFHYFYKEKKGLSICSFAGLTSVFLVWKNNEKYIEKGALHLDVINIGFNYVNEYIWNYYKEKLNNYPWEYVNSPMFNHPTFWIVNKNEGLFDFYESKFIKYYGTMARLGKITMFLSTNGFFFKKLSPTEQVKQIQTVFCLVEDIVLRGLHSLEENIKHFDITRPIFFHFIFQPSAYYDDNHSLNHQMRYINLNSFSTGNVVHIRFKIYENPLLNDINSANNRTVEAEFLRELFLPIKKYNQKLFDKINIELTAISSNAKNIGVYPVEISYLWEDTALSYNVSNESYHWARQRIAKATNKLGINYGEYRGKDANRIIRELQKNLIPDFELTLSNFNQYDLQITLESIYSRVIHEISILSLEYSNISDIDENTRAEIGHNIINRREELKHQKGVLEYLMESNLYCNRAQDKIASKNDLENLLAYANWLLVLSDNADFSYLSESDVHIVISHEKIINVVYDYIDNDFDYLSKRIYDDVGYEIKGDDIDKQFFLEATKAFLADTGINFSLLLDFLDFLSLHICKNEYNVVLPNVFQVNLDTLKNSFLSLCNSDYSDTELKSVIDFMTIKPSLLKTCAGKSDYYIPTGKRKLRNNRIELKCLWDYKGTIIYSPVMTHFSKEYWKNGFLDFFLPYNIELDRTQAALNLWKKRYEKQIVLDVEQCFKNCGYSKVYHNFDPRKINSKDSELQSLGDYDVMVVDTEQHIIWIVECKMLSKVGSIHDMYMQQEKFFNVHKDDEHFQRRIDFMAKNYHLILRYLNYDTNDSYNVEALMVINKVMISRYKKINFKILAIAELENFIKHKISNL